MIVILENGKALLHQSPHVFLVFGLLAYIVTGEFSFVMLSVYVLLTEIISEYIKGLLDGYSFSERSAGCIDPSEGGMPSTHSAVAAMFATFIVAKIWSTPGRSLFKILRTVAIVFIALVVILSRTELLEDCHSYLQVTAGGFLGMVLGLTFWRIDLYVRG
jgi:membrane-associated phospholipid phosphatase